MSEATFVRTLKPGLLIDFKTSITGGVHYERKELEAPPAVGTEEYERWETLKEVQDKEEHKRATVARSRVQYLVKRECINAGRWLLCPKENIEALDKGVKEARSVTEAFNATSKTCEISMHIIRARILEDDEEATRAIADEIGVFLDQIEGGIRRLDVEAVREAATKAKDVGRMLEEQQAEKVGEAVKAARAAARQIVKRIEKDGEDATKVLRELKLGAIEKARFAFLDTDEDEEEKPSEPEMPATTPQRFANVSDEEL